MEDEIETIKHRGCIIKIYRDDDTQSPDDWGDEEVFLVHYHRDFTIERNDIERNGFDDYQEFSANALNAIKVNKRIESGVAEIEFKVEENKP